MLRDLVLGRAVAPRRSIEHIEHRGRIDAGLDTHRQRFGGNGERCRRHQIVGELHRLAEARLLAELIDLAQHFEERADAFNQLLRGHWAG